MTQKPTCQSCHAEMTQAEFWAYGGHRCEDCFAGSQRLLPDQRAAPEPPKRKAPEPIREDDPLKALLQFLRN